MASCTRALVRGMILTVHGPTGDLNLQPQTLAVCISCMLSLPWRSVSFSLAQNGTTVAEAEGHSATVARELSLV